MARKKRLSYEEKMVKALRSIPNPIEDKRHGIFIYFIDERARSNESRFEHIIEKRHELLPSDIKRIPKCIKKPFLELIKKGRRHITFILDATTIATNILRCL